MHGRIALLAVAIACFAGALPAAATPQGDFDAVYNDWKPDRDVTACRFTQAQLQNAYDIATSNPDFQYETGFTDEVQTEIARWKSNGCAGVSPFKARRISPLNGAHIVAVYGRGNQAREYVRVKNKTKKTLAFRKATLRNKSKGRAAFPARFKLRAGKTAVVRVGCAKGKRIASFKGTRVWLCKRKPLFRDKGDAARLADATGTVVSQRGYGSERRRVAY
jgi:hypothetical protein